MADVDLGEYFPPGYGKFALSWTCLDTPYRAVCTMGFRNIGDNSAEECSDLLEDIWFGADRPNDETLMSDQWVQSDSYTLVQKIGFQLSWTSPHNTAGDVTDPGPSASNSIVVKKATDRAGKRYRGRFGWPPFLVAESAVDAGGAIGSGFLPGLQTVFSDALDAMTTANLPMVLIHRRITVDETPTPTIVTGLQVQPIMGVQRRRQRR